MSNINLDIFRSPGSSGPTARSSWLTRRFILVVAVFFLALTGGCGGNSDDDSEDVLVDVVDQGGEVDDMDDATPGDTTSDGDDSDVSDTSGDTAPDQMDVSDMSIDFGPPGDASCEDILGCLLSCDADDEVCQNGCIGSGTELAREEIQAYLGCVDRECPDAVTPTELTECVNENCSAEQAACLRI